MPKYIRQKLLYKMKKVWSFPAISAVFKDYRSCPISLFAMTSPKAIYKNI